MANLQADALSRNKSVAEWMIRRDLLPPLFSILGHPSVDLFASQRNAVCRKYFTIDRSDHRAGAIDAMLQFWGGHLLYAFPPPHLIPQCLAKFAQSLRPLILITPLWLDATWLGELISLSLLRPVALPLPALQEAHSKDLRSLQLVVWLLCRGPWPQRAFPEEWLNSSRAQSVLLQPGLTMPSGAPGTSGVSPIPWTLFLSLY